jgi:hypothetical protein
MFAKLARFQNFDCRLVRQPAILACPSNDNHPTPCSAASSQRPRLACRWRVTPTGALESVWHIDAGDRTAVVPEVRSFATANSHR